MPMPLTQTHIARLTALRHQLHRAPEAPREEVETAKIIAGELKALKPDHLITSIGGHGLAAIFDSGTPGPTLMFRSELDGLPIEDLAEVPHRSEIKGRGHLCGHDGHMVSLLGFATCVAEKRPAKGKIIILFQPAEEDGSGAAAMINDPAYQQLIPDFVYAYHNLPGLPFGHVAVAPGPANCASRGMIVKFHGKTAHASMPETGVSPMPALARLMPQLAGLSKGMPPAPDFTLATVTHVRMGEPVFGIAPSYAELFVTLRTLLDDAMAEIVGKAEALVRQAAKDFGLKVEINYDDIFVHCENAPEAVYDVRNALNALNIPHDERGLPIRASEDFGRFGHAILKDGKLHPPKSAMFYLGCGENYPQLHNPDYDYPDGLTPIAAGVFLDIARRVLG
jgi:amidohydrolase